MTERKSALMLTVVTVCIILFNGITVKAESGLYISPGLSMEFKVSDSNCFTFMEHFKQIDAVVSRLIQSSRPRGVISCRILITPDVKDKVMLQQTGELVTISLSNDYDKWRNDYQINKYLLSTITLCRLGIPPQENFNAIPQWMLAGMLGMVKQRYTFSRIVDTYYLPGLKICAAEGKIPELRKIISQPLYQESDGAAFEFYEEVCSFLIKKLESLSTGSEHILNDIIYLSLQKKYSQQEIFSSTAERVILERYYKNSSPDIADEKKIQGWFESVVREKALSSFNPFTAKEIKEKIAALRKVTCMVKNGNKESKQEVIDITELPEKLPEIENKNAVLLEKINIAESIRAACPQLLMEATLNLNLALNDIGSKSESASRGQLVIVLAALDKAVERQEAIENYLSEIERTKLPPSILYSREINVISRKDYAMWPSLNKYLDSVEKKFLED